MTRALTRVPQQRPLSIFLFFLCVFSGCTYALAVHSHHESAALSQFTVWCPGFAALCTCLLLRIPLGPLGWGWPARRFLRLAYFLPLIYAAPVYLLTWLVIRGAFSLNSFEAAMADTYGCLPSRLSAKVYGRLARNLDGAAPGCSQGCFRSLSSAYRAKD